MGYDYRILEARDRVGGLAWTVRRGSEHTEIGGERQVCTFDEGLYVNVGAWRIPYTHTGVLNYCKELGVPLRDLRERGRGRLLLSTRASAAGPLANKRVRLREVKADMIGHTNELLVKAIDQHQLDLPLTAEDKQRFVSYLVAQGYLDSSDHAYKALSNARRRRPLRRSARCCSRVSAAGCDRSPARSGTSAAPMFHPSAAWTRFASGSSARSAGTASRFNAEVQSVHQSDTGVKVVYANTKERDEHRSHRRLRRRLHAAVVLAGVDINLSPEMMDARSRPPRTATARRWGWP